jgi:transglutaminase-like putative cysteine protease
LKRERITVDIIATGRTGDTVLTIGQARRIDRATIVEQGDSEEDIVSVESSRRLREGADYEASGTITTATEDDLRAAGDDYPEWTERYRELPNDFSPRVENQAADLERGNAYDTAKSIESYLRNIPYSLDVPDAPPGVDPVEYFLFETHRGYFDYHASAMVVMLRSLDIPARFAVGYVLDAENYEDGHYRVTEENAFAWPEVYFPDYGWVEFNPTPSYPTILRQGDPTLAGASEDSPGEGSDVPPGGFNFGTGQPLEEETGGGTFVAPEEQSDNTARTVLLGIAAALGAIFVVGAAWISFAWTRGMRGLSPVERRWAQTVRLASWARLSPESGATPREYARSLREREAELDETEVIARAYVRERYGRERISDGEMKRIEQAWRNVRGTLLRRFIPFRESPTRQWDHLEQQRFQLDNRLPRL